MADVVYTRAFWEKALELASRAPKQCEGSHGCTILKGVCRRRARVVCVDGDTTNPKSVRLLCTTCHPDPVHRMPWKKTILAKIADLPFENPEAPKGAHA